MGKRGHHHTKKTVGFDANPPRCGNCKRYSKSLPKVAGQINQFPELCSMIGYGITSMGVCDFWMGHDGTTLDAPAPTNQEYWDTKKFEWKTSILDLVKEYRDTGHEAGATGRNQEAVAAPIFEEIAELLGGGYAP